MVHDARAISGRLLAENVVTFGRLLRRVGLSPSTQEIELFIRALTALGLANRNDAKAAGRTIFTRRREERGLYEAAFDLYWRRSTIEGGISVRLPRIRQRPQRGGLELGEQVARADVRESVTPVRPDSASTREQLRNVDFAELTPSELRDADRMIEALRPRLPHRRGRRPEVSRSGSRPAARRMLRRALSTAGEQLEWRWLRRTKRPRPVVLVCDISGSMERYSRFLLRFAHALSRCGAPIEAFVFGTRLTRITRQLRSRDADVALARVAERVVDWSGGTQIGPSLKQLNRQWVRRTIRSGAVVLIVSDGWERGDPELLRRQTQLLRRSCHRLVWLTPLAQRPGFQPLTLGLQAAIPHVDALIPCGNVASLEALAKRLKEWE